MLKKVTLLVSALLFSAFVTGCSTLDNGAGESVAVESYPAGANVYLNGELAGQTPTTLDIGRKTSNTLRLEKDGYKNKTIMVVPTENDNAQNVVKFGPLYDLGYYQNLTPNPVSVNLVPSEIPTSRSADQYAEMVELISKVDQERESGQIGPEEHKYKVEQIIEFYSN